MRHAVAAFLAASAFLACAAGARAQTATPPAEPAAAASAEDKLVCVVEDAGGNSRLGTSRKVCHTQKEWDSLPRSRR